MSQKVDYILKMFVTWVEQGQTLFNITLHVGGTLVEGTVVSSRTYFVEMGHMFQDMYAEQAPQEGVSPEKISEQVENFDGMIEQLRGVQVTDPEFINLKDVRIYSPSNETVQFEQPQHPYWRFKLEDISGWTFGARPR